MTKIIADQPTNATSDGPGPEFLPLRGLANILTVLLAVVAFIWVRLAIQLLSPGSIHYFTDWLLSGFGIYGAGSMTVNSGSSSGDGSRAAVS
jgi:hypothetical protein